MNTTEDLEGRATSGDDPRLPVVRHRDPALGFCIQELVEPTPGWRAVARPWSYALPGDPFELRVLPVPLVGLLQFGGSRQSEVSPLIGLADGDHLLPLQFWVDLLHVGWLAPGERLSERHAELAIADLAREVAAVPLVAQVGARLDRPGAYAPGALSWSAVDRARRRWPELVYVDQACDGSGEMWLVDRPGHRCHRELA